MAKERINPDRSSPQELNEHLGRYTFAASYVLRGETVLDAACGTGYARGIFEPWATWIGVDKFKTDGVIEADLQTWEGWRDLSYDVFVGIETYEHLYDLTNYIQMARAAKRQIVLSTPVIPTTKTNQYHVRDHTAADVIEEVAGLGWDLEEYREQVDVYGLFAFKRR